MVYLLHDTDIGGDSDDMAETFLIEALRDNGECQSVAETCVCNGDSRYGQYYHTGQCMEVAKNWYGNFYVPIGILRNSALWLWDVYASAIASEYASTLLRYADENDIPNALLVQRQALVDAADGSVHMVTTGPLRNLRHLYESPADDISPLTGAELMRLKLNELVIALGVYLHPDDYIFPEGDDTANLPADPWGAEVINQLATDEEIKVVWVDLGYEVYTDVNGIAMNPLKRAFQLWTGYLWHSWGAMAILYAVRGLSFGGTEYFHYSAKGKRTYTAPAHVLFTFDSGNQYWLYRSQGKSFFTDIITPLCCRAPTHLGTDIPYLSAINPSQAYPDTNIDPTILTGKRFTGATVVSMGEGITVGSFSVDSDEQITIHPTIDKGAVMGFRDVLVTIPTGDGVRPGMFELLPVDLLSANLMAYDGYRCFMEQYIKRKVAGLPPFKLPNGTTWE